MRAEHIQCAMLSNFIGKQQFEAIDDYFAYDRRRKFNASMCRIKVFILAVEYFGLSSVKLINFYFNFFLSTGMCYYKCSSLGSWKYKKGLKEKCSSLEFPK